MTAYSYNNGVPATNNDPSVDQPNMLINTQSINSIIATDHVGFNSTGPAGGIGGQHLQCTFNGNNVPSLPATLATLFANNQDGNGNNLPNGLSQLFAYSGSAAQSQLQYTLNSSSTTYGSVMLFGGLIMKFGTVPSISNSGTTVAFGEDFPTVCYGAIANGTSGGAFITTSASVSGVTLTSRGGTVPGFYIAIGL